MPIPSNLVVLNKKDGRLLFKPFIQAADGTSTLPGICFISGPTSGLHCDTSGKVHYIENGVDQGLISYGVGTARQILQTNAAGTAAEWTSNIAPGLGTAAAPSISFVGDPNTGIYSPGADQVAISTNGSNRLHIASDGKVGVGTSSPDALMHLYNAAGDAILKIGVAAGASNYSRLQLQQSSNNSWQIISGGNDNKLQIGRDGVANFLAIDSSGRVGIGTSSPSFTLDIKAATANCLVESTTGTNIAYGSYRNFNGNLYIGRERSTGGALAIGSTAYAGVISVDSADKLQLATNNTVRATIDSAGNVGIGTTSPSAALSVVGGAGTTLVATVTSQVSGSYVGFFDTATTDRPMIGALANDFAFRTNGVERARIDSSGRLGIGTTSPGNTLHLAATGNHGIKLERTGGNPGSASLVVTTDGASQYSADQGIDIKVGNTYNAFTFTAGATERARIDSSGRLLVGTASDSGGALLQVNGDRVRIATAKTPASASATGTAGEICWDASYIYVCTATNTWKRTAIATW